MALKFWALKEYQTRSKHRKLVGPCATREEAIEEFRKLYPFKGKAWEASASANQIMTGYGEFGPYSDMRWHPWPIATPASAVNIVKPITE